MNQFNWYKAFGFGAIIWLIMFALVSAVVGFGITMGVGWSLTLAIAVGVLSYLFAINAKAGSSGQAWGYGFIWAAIGIILDWVISYRFASGIFTQWTYWVGYALVIAAPWIEYEFQGVGAHQKAV